MQNKEFINKNEALKKGYIKRNDGIYYKKSVLEKYYEGGYLELENSQFSAEDRLKVGKMLAKDYYLGNYNTLQSVKLNKTNIRTTGEYCREQALFYQQRYLSAIKNVPIEFWLAVRRVCIEDEELSGNLKVSSQSLLGKNLIFYQKKLLVLGLERLIKY